MYSQVQVPIHGNTIECAVKINFILVFFKVVKLKNYIFRVNNAQTIEIGTCITYLTDSNTIKNCWYWLDTETDTRNQCSPTPNYNLLTYVLQIVTSDNMARKEHIGLILTLHLLCSNFAGIIE